MAAKVLITAGASGIGLEFARGFLASGAKVYICDINETALDAARATLTDFLTGLCDVGDRASVETMVAEGAKALGGIYVLINNVEIGGPTKPVVELDPVCY